MQKFSAYIIGLASVTFLVAATFNAQLTWNADRFYEKPQEIVHLEGKSYAVNTEYNDLLRIRHTNKLNQIYSERGHKKNVRALSTFFGLVK